MKTAFPNFLLALFFLCLAHANASAQSNSVASTMPVAANSEIAVMRVYEGRGMYGSRIVVAYESGKTDEVALKDFKSSEFYSSMTQQVQIAMSKLYKAGYVLVQSTGGGGMSETSTTTNLIIIETFVFRKS
ncbi:hypothetical protein ACFP2F_22180 [Hymenobacter artigasi]|uniref:Uncharacterized protein n=1 Tax=Hymenobacter artigasi TaxID=2719616 RepID=A0ABX1HM18_9BACT|nr:hypothetical protein [Hymenobacter artigasi]NKI90041.1 hypothetical protein [Hymenobacter artigasi]